MEGFQFKGIELPKLNKTTHESYEAGAKSHTLVHKKLIGCEKNWPIEVTINANKWMYIRGESVEQVSECQKTPQKSIKRPQKSLKQLFFGILLR